MKNQILMDTINILENGAHHEVCSHLSHLKRELQEPWDQLTIRTINLCIDMIYADFPDPE